MVENAEAIVADLKARAENREPEHDIGDVLGWAEDLCADLGAHGAELEPAEESSAGAPVIAPGRSSE